MSLNLEATPMITKLAPYFFGFLLALVGALVAQWLNSPLPWLIGPLLVTAISSMSGLKTRSHNLFRNMGQWVIGTTLGLYFSPQMVQTIVQNTPYIITGLLFALLLGIFNALALRQWGRIDFKTAWFAGAIGGASEMANLAERYKARVDSVASAHSLRVLMVVIIIPFTFKFLGIQGNSIDPNVSSYHFDGLGFIGLIALTVCAGLVFKRLNIPNPWVLGPLLIAALLTSNSIHFSHLPPEVSKLGQLFIGWSLGSKYGPDFFSRAPRFLSVVALVNSVALCLAAGFAYLLSLLSDIPLSTLILSVSPGGITEMTITAKVLMLGAPMVAAFHVTRMVFILLVTQPLYKIISKWLERRA